MQLTIDFSTITRIFSIAHEQQRDYLFEYEVYELLALSGAETPPKTLLIPRGSRPTDEDLSHFTGEKIVLKIVSPTIVHKTETQGVRIVPRIPEKVRAAVRRMFYEVPENFAALVERHPEHAPQSYAGLQGDDLLYAIENDVRGVMLTQFMPPDSSAFGNELIVGLRHSREFGTIISAGLGGTDTELYAKRFCKGQAIVAASVEMLDGEGFFRLFRKTISYQKLSGRTRGQQRIVSDEQLIECFSSFIHMGKYYSAQNPTAPFIIEELEINPFAFTDYLMVPLDGLCRFSLPHVASPERPIHKIHNLLHPERIGIMGVSATRKNFGRMILDNILGSGFPKENIVLFHEKECSIDDVSCLSNLDALTEPVDLLVMAVGAESLSELVPAIIDKNAAHAVMLIAGNMGETHDSVDRAEKVIHAIEQGHMKSDGGPVFIGANCMGVVSHPGNYDTWFIPKEKFPQDYACPQTYRAALISQSGAFMVHRMSQMPELSPAYMISIGNQSDLTLGDMVTYFSTQDHVDVIAVYAEGFKDGDGLTFVRAVRNAVQAGKMVVFYKAGRTPEGKNATSGHTASLAGDYMVCESCVQEAGAIVTRTFTEFQNVFMLAEHLHHKRIGGRRLAAVSGAGFEAVGMADSIQSDAYSMRLCDFSSATTAKIEEILKENKLDKLVTAQNPLDINPAANDKMHMEIAKILLEDAGIDAVVMSFAPLSPFTHTLADPEATLNMYTPQSMVHLAKQLLENLPQSAAKPLIGIVDGGSLYYEYRRALVELGIPIFHVCDDAIAALALYMEARIKAKTLVSCS